MQSAVQPPPQDVRCRYRWDALDGGVKETSEANTAVWQHSERQPEVQRQRRRWGNQSWMNSTSGSLLQVSRSGERPIQVGKSAPRQNMRRMRQAGSTEGRRQKVTGRQKANEAHRKEQGRATSRQRQWWKPCWLRPAGGHPGLKPQPGGTSGNVGLSGVLRVQLLWQNVLCLTQSVILTIMHDTMPSRVAWGGNPWYMDVTRSGASAPLFPFLSRLM